jgi:hypothetical protein
MGAIQVYGDYGELAYDNPIVIPFPPFLVNDSYLTYAGGVRYDRSMGARLSGTVSIAYSFLRPSFSFTPGFSGVTYSAELNYRMSSRLSVRASVSRADLPTFEIGAAYIIDNRRQIDASYRLGQRLNLTIGVFDDADTFQGVVTDNVNGLVTSSRTDSVFGSVSMALNRRLSASLYVTNQYRSANVALYSYTDDSVSLTLRSVF